jgi:glutamine cyclotransferase
MHILTQSLKSARPITAAMVLRPLKVLLLAVGLCLAGLSTAVALAAVPTFVTPEIIATFPHDDGAFTQGLSIHDGVLLESTGRYGQSSLRRVDLRSGEVQQRVDLPADIFGEGSVRLGDQIFVLSWQAGIGFVFDATSFEALDRFSYAGQGWGLTSDGQSLIMSDGSPVLRFLDPQTREVTGTLTVTYNGAPLRNLNELEWVDGMIWANVWMTRQIVVIDPASGAITQVLDLSHAVPPTVAANRDAVLNGIAYDEATGRIFITGKLWPVLHEIARPMPLTQLDN